MSLGRLVFSVFIIISDLNCIVTKTLHMNILVVIMRKLSLNLKPKYFMIHFTHKVNVSFKMLQKFIQHLLT